MSKYVLLLRGVNVGKGNRLPMAGLRTLLEAQGFKDVTTILNSGNAIFSAEPGSAGDFADLIRKDISKTFGMDIHTHVESAAGLGKIISENDILSLADDHSRLLVIFGREQKNLHALTELEHLLGPEEHLSIGQNAGYLYCPKGVSDSRFAIAMLGKHGKSLTSRNWKTIIRIAASL